MMQSLEEKALMAVLKTGIWKEQPIPLTIRNNLEQYEEIIESTMFGFCFYDYGSPEKDSFDVFWAQRS